MTEEIKPTGDGAVVADVTPPAASVDDDNAVEPTVESIVSDIGKTLDREFKTPEDLAKFVEGAQTAVEAERSRANKAEAELLKRPPAESAATPPVVPDPAAPAVEPKPAEVPPGDRPITRSELAVRDFATANPDAAALVDTIALEARMIGEPTLAKMQEIYDNKFKDFVQAKKDSDEANAQEQETGTTNSRVAPEKSQKVSDIVAKLRDPANANNQDQLSADLVEEMLGEEALQQLAGK